MKKTKTIAVVSEKGGVGKTATLLNLAGSLVINQRKKVLVVDLNPQQDLSTNLGYVPPTVKSKTISEYIYDQLEGVDFPIVAESDKAGFIKHTDYGLDYMPANRNTLEILPRNLSDSEEDNMCVANVLKDKMFADYDYVFIDCKDSLVAHLVPQVLIAADYAMPITEVGINSLFDVSEVIKKISHRYPVSIIGVVLNKVTEQSNITKNLLSAAREEYGEYLFKTQIPDRKAQIEQANDLHLPCVIARNKHRKQNTLAGYYTDLATEFLEKVKEMEESI